VQSLWAVWRDEKSVFRSLHELSITNGALTGGLVDHGMGIPGEYQKKIRGSMRIGYPSQQNGYPQQQNGYPQQQNGYPPQQNGYPQQQNGYPPQQNGYPPQQNGYPQQQNGYSPHNGYSSQQLGYNNPAFTTSSSHINGSLSVTKYGNNNTKHLKRSISSASQYVSASRLSLTNVGLSQGLGYLPQPVGYLSQPISYRSSQHGHGGLSKNEFNTSLFNSGVRGTHSQFDLPSFGLDPDAPIFQQGGYGPGGLPMNGYMVNSRHGKSGNQTMEWYRPRSLVNLEDDNASIWSGGYGGNYADYSTQSLDRRKMRNGGLGHRAQSMGALNMGYMSEEEFRRTAVGSVSGQLRPYHLQNGSKQSLGQQSDSPERYRDIAL